jgi:aminopeptidase YwaD
MAATLCIPGAAFAQKPPLLPEKDVAALANELSGETAKRNLEGIARFHRQRGSKGFHEAAELVAERLRAYGLSHVAILQFPADGKIFYGTQRSRPAWDAEKGDLSEVHLEFPENCEHQAIKGNSAATSNTVDNTICFDVGERKVASYEAEPAVLAEDSESADVTAELVDVGAGTKESDYAGKDAKGKLVLVSAQPGAVQDLAVGKLGAAGIISYAQNQPTGWSRENQDAIRWGHLDTFSPNKTFAFMVSLKTAHQFRSRLATGEKITLRAIVKAGQHPGNYEVVTAIIPGSDPKLKDEEIAFSCHLDHQRPGGNDNASGCATILEVARTLQKLTARQMSGGCVESKSRAAQKSKRGEEFNKWLSQDCDFLIGAGEMESPARTIRFLFPPEIEGTMALLNSPVTSYEQTWQEQTGQEIRPDLDVNLLIDGKPISHRIKAVIHMDMVGGGPETKAVFHVTRGPLSLPSFVHDVAWAFADWLNDQSYQFAATGEAAYPMIAPAGGKEPLRAEYSAYTMGSDHDVYQDSSFGIPAVYLNDWPDRFIHTNFDSAANIDSTKLKRAAFIGAASGYFLAKMTGADYGALLDAIKANQYKRTGQTLRRASQLSGDERKKLVGEFVRSEQRLAMSIDSIVPVSIRGDETRPPLPREDNRLEQLTKQPAPGAPLPNWKRKSEPQGPLTVFGYDYFADHARSAGIATPKLLDYQGLWGSGEEYAYEVLNFADGNRNAQQIRDAVSAEYGPIPFDLVLEYLQALEKIGLLEQVKLK